MEQNEKNEQANNTCDSSTDCCDHSIEVEHLEDGYRITVRGDKERIEQQRRVADAYVEFLREQKKARWWLPLPLRWLLRWFKGCK
ncbi:hypothetical protein JJB07_06245 [Tumebacillus sp. ITR2]|uniref:Uncharacterized protein n=1 Tax=Tumebacillus amylolyticus TaxID=2801339 RepID=A0ABS1J7K2_9BACL|nr:hypothetical protein [Tumebacillus amylolyticus]MBL0386252.1 hypothetical protein [Tumebacillus amylolyticus]